VRDQLALDVDPEPAPYKDVVFAGGHTVRRYTETIATAAKEAGLEAARVGDPDGFELAVDTIRRLIRDVGEVDGDDVRAEHVVTPSAIGAAFAYLAKRGEIRYVGYRVSAAPSRKGGLQRSWAAP
jgi:hypothetical protein